MNDLQGKRVEGPERLKGTISATHAESGQVEVTLETGQRMLVSAASLEHRPDGSYELRLGGPNQPPGETIPIVREELHVEKRTRKTGRVVVQVVPEVRHQVVDLPLAEEKVEIERIPVQRVIEQAPPVRQEGEVTIVPVVEEVLVVEKRLMLKEEIRIIRHRSTRQHHEEIPLRVEDVRISRSEIPPTP